MAEAPLGHVFALLPGVFVREAEVDALVDTGVYHILGHVREAVIRARVFDGWTSVVIWKVISSVPKKSASARVTAPVTLFAPEV